MSWTAHHHRGDVLRAALEEIERRGDATLPTNIPGLRDCFHDVRDLTGALQFRWHNRLVGCLEQRLARRPDDLDAAVRDAWADAALSMPGLRALLDAQLGEPADASVGAALERARAKERQLLATMAGRAGRLDQRIDPRAVEQGHEIERAARIAVARTAREIAEPQRVPRGSASFVRRLKAVLAA